VTPAETFQQALELQDAIVAEQTPPGAAVDALGRPVLPCCGALDLGDSRHGGRPFQCLCQLELFREDAAA